MVQPMSPPARTAARRSGRSLRPFPADRFAGRWPATDQLVNEIASARLRIRVRPQPTTDDHRPRR